MPREQFRPRLSPEETNRGVGISESRVSQRRVAWILVLSRCVISWMCNRHLTHEDPSHRHGGGRDRATTQRQGRFCWFSLDVNGFRTLHPGITSSGTELECAFLHKHWLTDSMRCVRTECQDTRYMYTCIRVRWTIRGWTPVVFTDESRFCLNFTDRCQLVWRMSKERFNELNVAEHGRYDKGSVMV